MNVTINTIAKMAGVSPATVSRYLNQGYVSEEKKEADSNMFEGMISVRAVLNTGCKNRMITRLLYAKERTDKNRREFRWLTGEAEKYGFTVETPPRSEIDKLALGTSHGGVIAFCTQRKYPELDISFVESTKRTGFYVMIEGIEDPFNFGYALRSVYSAGADAVILSRRNWMSAAGVVCRSSAGASALSVCVCSGSAAVSASTARSGSVREDSSRSRESSRERAFVFFIFISILFCSDCTEAKKYGILFYTLYNRMARYVKWRQLYAEKAC